MAVVSVPQFMTAWTTLFYDNVRNTVDHFHIDVPVDQRPMRIVVFDQTMAPKVVVDELPGQPRDIVPPQPGLRVLTTPEGGVGLAGPSKQDPEWNTRMSESLFLDDNGQDWPGVPRW